MAVAQRSTHEPQEYALGRWDSRPDDSTMAGSLTREQDVASGCDDDGFDGVDSTRQRRRDPVDLSARWDRHSPGVEWTLTTRPAAAVLEKEGPGAAASRAIGTLEAHAGWSEPVSLRCRGGPGRAARRHRGPSRARTRARRHARRVGKRYRW